MRLAKLCSGKNNGLFDNLIFDFSMIDINKPNGQYQLEANVNVILNFIRNLPIRKVLKMSQHDFYIEVLYLDKRYWKSNCTSFRIS